MTIRSIHIGPYTCFADHESNVGQMILQNGENYERHMVAEIRRLAPLAKGFADLGANIGIHILIAKWANPSLPVVCAECSPDNQDLLMRNIRFNRLTDVTVLPFALADKPRIIKTNSYMPNMCCSLDGEPDSESYARLAGALSLDTLILPPIDLIKIDVEGFEIRVLTGASTIMKSRPTVLFEFCPQITHRSSVTPTEMLSFFFDRGYKLTMLDFRQRGERKQCATPDEVIAHLAATSIEITDILAEPA